MHSGYLFLPPVLASLPHSQSLKSFCGGLSVLFCDLSLIRVSRVTMSLELSAGA